MVFNEFQSSLEELHIDDYPKEVQDDFYNFIESVPHIGNMVSIDRPYVKDLPRDEKGRAIIDITNPPLFKDIDYFRPVARHFKETGRITDLRPNPNPNSEYGKWLKTEADRIWNGYLRKSDGMWIPGDMYWYLNYTPIMISKQIENSKVSERVLDFPHFWEGIWWRYLGWDEARNEGLNFAEIAKRGASKSFCSASKLAKNFIFGESKDACQNVVSLVLGYQKEYLNRDGTLNKFENMIDFLAQNTEFPSLRLKSSLSEMEWQAGYIDLNTGTKKGVKNQVLGVSVKDDLDKVRGKRASFIMAEEFGAFPNFINIYQSLLPSVRDGDTSFGFLTMVGTGGSEGNDFYSAMEMMYNPKGYYLKSYPNVWDKAQSSKGESIFFFPAYVNRVGCYNKDGISDVTKALLAICAERFNVKYNTSDPNQITRTKAENPVTIQEAILRSEGNFFPAAALTERLQQIEGNPSFYDDVYVGKMTIDSNGTVSFIPTDDKPIRNFPHKDNKLEGAIEIYKMPERDSSGKVYSNRYIASLDPVDADGNSDTMSLNSAFVLDLWTDKIVAEYTGRPLISDDFFEQLRLLLLYFNAKCNYENNKKGCYSYFQKMRCLYLLSEQLDFLKDRDFIKGQFVGNKQYGTYTNSQIKKYGLRCIRDWLLKPVENIVQNDDGTESIVMNNNISFLRQKSLIQELIQYNPDGNFDRVSSLIMLMLLREDRLIVTGGSGKIDDDYDDGYLGNDTFFTQNYEARFDKIGINNIRF